METREGVLEILLVSAEGLKHAHHLRRSKRHYVNVQCGDQILSSKITQGKGKKIWWNEKFRFPLSDAECKEPAKVTLTIMERDQFAEDTSVGETKVHVGEIIREGSEREFLQMKPAPYSIVLEDGTYKGVLKLGLKFISNIITHQHVHSFEHIDEVFDRDLLVNLEHQCSVPSPRQPRIAYGSFLNFALPSIPWRSFFFFCSRSNDGQSSKKEL